MAVAEALPFLFDSMKCLICLDYADKAVETECCGQIYCEKCIQDLLSKNCPSCRRPALQSAVSRTIRKMVSEIPSECPNQCGEKVTRGTITSHKEICRLREYYCMIEGCEFSGLFPHLIEHFGVKHPRDVFCAMNLQGIRKVDIMTQTGPKKTYYCPYDDCVNTCETTRENLIKHIKNFHSQNAPPKDLVDLQAIVQRQRPILLPNFDGVFASMAENGKFYCQRECALKCLPQPPPGLEYFASLSVHQQMERTKTICTHKNESRLNCWACMKLDVVLRSLQKGSLINGAGRVSKFDVAKGDVNSQQKFPMSYYEDQGKPTYSCGIQFTQYATHNAPRDAHGPLPGQYQSLNIYRGPVVKGSQLKTCAANLPCTDCSFLKSAYAMDLNGHLDTSFPYYQPVWD